jgi:flagellar biosynthesis/type III secretory pathway protein FliH
LAVVVVSMKSSNNIVSAGKGSALSVWSPEAFEEGPVKDDVTIEKILSFFISSDPDQKKNGAKKNPFRLTEDVKDWNPEELDWVPPFNFSGWEGWAKQEQAPSQPAEEIVIPVETNEALDVLVNARQQAEEIILQAQIAADQAIQQAQEEIKNAVSDGFQRGWAAAQTEANSYLAAAKAVVEETNSWRSQMLAESERTVVAMIQQIAKSMFSDGIQLDEKTLQENLSRVLENAKSLGDLRIYLSPLDAGRLDPTWREYQTLVTGNKIQIIPSDGIKPGGCFVQGQLGSVDAQVNTQLDELLAVFVETDEVMENA